MSALNPPKNLFTASVASLLLTGWLVISLNTQDGRHLLLETASLGFGLILLMNYYFRHYDKPVLLPRQYCVFFYLAFIVWAGFSVLWSAAQAVSLMALTPFIGGLLALVIAYTYSAEQAKIQMQLLLLLAVFLSIYTLYQALILNIYRPTGLLKDWNSHAAFLTLLLLPLCGQFLIHQKTQRHSLLIGACCGLLCLAISLTLSRGALLALFIGLLLIGTLAFLNKMQMASFLKLCAWLVSGFALAELLNQHETFSSRLNAAANASSLEALGSGRHLLWQPAWEMYLDRPFLGWGFSTFHLLYHQYKAPLTTEAGFYVHNDYLEFLLELGPIGLGLFLGFVVTLVHYAIKLLKLSNNEGFSSTHFHTFSLLAASLGLLVCTAFNFNLYQLPIQILFGMYVGRTLNYFTTNQTSFIPAETMTAKRYYSILSGFSLLPLIFLGAILFALFNMNKIATAQNQDDKLDFAWKAQLFFPFLASFDYQKTLQTISLLKSTTLSANDKQPISEMGLELIESAIYKYTLNPLNYVAKAELLKATDTNNINTTQIKRNYAQALKLEPNDFKIRDDYAGYLLEKQENAKALALFWDSWGRYHVNFYQNGIVFLTHQLQINKQFGKAEDNQKIEKEINRLETLKKVKPAGEFVFQQ
jgi:O-antigen ligase